MGRYTVLQALSACEDNMCRRNDAILLKAAMLVKFCAEPATSKASLYTSVTQVCRGLPCRRAEADSVS